MITFRVVHAGQDEIEVMEEFSNDRHKRCFSAYLAVAGAIGGLLFGYDIGVISGSLSLLSNEFDLSSVEQEMVVAIQAVGSMFGACFGGYVCDYIGRIRTVGLCVFMFMAGAIVLYFSNTLAMLCIGRIIIGIGISVSSIADVAFLAEVSPAEYRGAVISTYDLGVTLGILLAYLVNSFLTSWRAMFLLPVPFAVLWYLLMYFLPESPRWLLLVEQHEEALNSLTRIYGGIEEAHRSLEVASSSIMQEKNARTLIFLDFVYKWKLQLGLVLFLMISQQLSGNAVLLTYRPDVYSNSTDDDSSDDTDTFIIILGCVKVLGTSIALYFVDRIGRRLLLLVGICAMCFSWPLIILAGFFNSPTLAVIGACLVVTSYSVSFGCLSWVIVSEIFPDEYRSRAIGFSLIINWLFNFAVMSSYISMSEGLTESGAFAFYLLMCILSLVAGYYFVPETKSRDHIEINADLISKIGAFFPSALEGNPSSLYLGRDDSPSKYTASMLSDSKSSSHSNSNLSSILVLSGDSNGNSNGYSPVHNEMHLQA